MKRLVVAYRRDGAAGLVSRRVGQPSNRRLKEPVRGLQIELGLWKPKRRKAAHAFQLRARRGRFGELIQIDGSPHDWFEGRGGRCTLIVFIDDATGRLVQLRFFPAETTAAYMFLLRAHLERYGRPVALYSDRHSIFRLTREEAANGHTLTQFGRALAGLEIEAIQAHSPQAKGRVERANQTLQDRLVKELRLRGIDAMEAANAFLPEFIADDNRRFAVVPSREEDAHRALAHRPRELDLLLCEHHARVLSKNLALQFRNVLYQVRHDGPGYRLRGAKVTVCALPSGEVALLYVGRELPYTTSRKGERPPPLADDKTLNACVDGALAKQQGTSTPLRQPPLTPPTPIRRRDRRTTPHRPRGLTPVRGAPPGWRARLRSPYGLPASGPPPRRYPPYRALPTGDISTLGKWGHLYFGLTAEDVQCDPVTLTP